MDNVEKIMQSRAEIISQVPPLSPNMEEEGGCGGAAETAGDGEFVERDPLRNAEPHVTLHLTDRPVTGSFLWHRQIGRPG